ncbi:DAK2 domain-containing protein [Mycoplasma sp. SG1]|uniref:DAK2 domain-containing protein n=1 Tax=Mycoplasma sp. SG1 TaxID=2810348 RepID=UPI002024DABD|nr:DAK2 domain-containing protein [Mycoplasma sp. SG1]URM53203.1 DAK2 domain-containing protein [Mycoplasma sp. SG1]
MNAILLKKALINGVKNLVNNQTTINDCNYFPVPDRDTGTNMAITAINAYVFFNEYNGDDCKVLLELFSKGAFFGARGNSGIILSQIFDGMYQGISENCKQITYKNLTKLLNYAVKTSKKSVIKVAKFSIISVLSSAYKQYKYNISKNVMKDVKYF